MAATDRAGVDRSQPLYTLVGSEKKRVAYFYDSDIGNYAYATGHPMKPHRIRLAHSLVMNYGVYKFLEVYRAKPAVFTEMTQFHTDEYIDFLQKVTPENMDSYVREQGKYNVGDDCPVFDGLFEFCGISAGGSMEGAARLNRNKCDIAVNWAGGLHHAKKSEGSGFCYVNDIVLAILELLRYKKRVLYLDIDVHHGDGVEEAFYTTDRVMTVSFHKYGEYFPGTGELRDIGIGQGKNYSVNFPLRDGIDDETYVTIFQPVVEAVMKYYQPEAVVLQCGGDSLSGDRLGAFNLSMRGHAGCVDFIRKYNLPTLVLGGGGYTMRNVARTWAYETGRLVGLELGPILPYNEYYDYYGPDYELDVRSSNMENANSHEYLEKIKIALIENLKKTAPAPSVQMQDIPRASLGMTDEEEAELDDLNNDQNPDVRMTERDLEKKVARHDEFEDSDDEDMEANGHPSTRPPRRSIMEYDNAYADREDNEGRPLPKKSPQPTNGTNAAKEATGEVTMDDAAPAATPNGDSSKTSDEIAKPAVADNDGDIDMADASTEPSVGQPAVKDEDSEAIMAVSSDPKPKEPSAEKPDEDKAVKSSPGKDTSEAAFKDQDKDKDKDKDKAEDDQQTTGAKDSTKEDNSA